MYIPSVKEAANMIIKYYKSEDFEKLKAVGDYLENRDVAKSIAGDSSSFHNATVSLSRNGFYDYAYALAKVGHSRYSCDADLLGDLILYGLRCRPLDDLQEWCSKLENINKRFWTWRAYQFSFDYWMERLPYAKSDEELGAWEKKVEELVESFKQNFQFLSDKSDCEKAFLMEHNYYASKGDEKKAISALVAATTNPQTKDKCPQCSLSLADYYFGIGKFSEAYKYADKAVKIKEDQSSIDLGYTYYILAMSLEYIEREKNSLKNNIRKIYTAYYSAFLHLNSDRLRLLESVKKQVSQLEFEFEVPSSIPFDRLMSDKHKDILSLLASFQELDDE